MPSYHVSLCLLRRQNMSINDSARKWCPPGRHRRRRNARVPMGMHMTKPNLTLVSANAPQSVRGLCGPTTRLHCVLMMYDDSTSCCPPLTSCVASSHAASQAVKRGPKASWEIIAHDHSTDEKSRCSPCDSSTSAPDVNNMLATLQSAMLALNKEESRTVHTLCTEV